ncbi:hypothetical protein Ccrd_024480 [Cynara cardunculus var. scolymus]|uniref:Uncharacterized protein n=1 Tax=Cynara cardunculus var. scolymus TaxID=59895 RepID=A0A118JRT8_CYNCS|nr:hypothetical protein Ccrd_024480 [Cynara cardunculus var. scolymus]
MKQSSRTNSLLCIWMAIYVFRPIKGIVISIGVSVLAAAWTNALEMVVKKILCQSDAAEFLVAFAGIQESVHQFSKDYKLRKGPVSVSLSSSSEIVGVDSSHSISKFL